MPSTIASPSPIGVFIVEADPAQRRTLSAILGRERGFRVSTHADRASARDALMGAENGVVIADLDTIGGIGSLRDTGAGRFPLIATSGDASLNTAVAALQGGAVDFLPKPIGARALMDKVKAAIAAADAGRPAKGAQQGSTPTTSIEYDYGGFVGRSPVMMATYRQIDQVAASTAPVFITGESGTGKELCAEAVHRQSGAAGRPFVAINCGAIPAELMESEMFGHVRGAFTGAVGERTGAAELAHGGTLFLDEIAEMSLTLQTKLLRFLDSGEVRRVGGMTTSKVDVRIVCATNRDPYAELEAGGFRLDLFYRLYVLPIHLAPLRARSGDVRRLAEHMRRRFVAQERRSPGAFEGRAIDLMTSYPWPGNVRQLANVVRRMVAMSTGDVLGAELLPAEIVESRPANIPPADARSAVPAMVAPMHQREREIIEEALAAHDGSVTGAAAALQINSSTIYRKRRAWKSPK